MAALGDPHSSRAKSLGDDPDRSQAVDLRPREVAAGDESCAGGMEVSRRNVVDRAAWEDLRLRSSFLRTKISSQFGSAPLMGTEAAKPAEETPGIAASLSRMLFCMRVTVADRGPASPESKCASPAAMRDRRSRDRRCASPAKVRIISTALISSTSAMATCATTSRLRPRCRSRLALAVRVAPSSGRRACREGA